MISTHQIDAVLFDLDGTLLDTARDLVDCANIILAAHGRAPLPETMLRPWVSQGGLKTVSVAFDISSDTLQAQQLHQQYLDEYASRLCRYTALFDGMSAVLDQLASLNKPWGVVTNKPAWLTDPLMQQIGLAKHTNCIVSGDTVAKAKPAADPVLHACTLIDVPANRCLMVGDDRRDIQSGNAAGTVSLAAAWGYLREDDDPHSWQARAVLQHPDQLHEWIA